MTFVPAPNGIGGRVLYAGISLPRRYAQVLALSGAGYKLRDMAKVLGVAKGTIKRYSDDLRDLGYDARTRSLTHQVRIYNAELSHMPVRWRQIEIARRVGITRKRLYIIQAYIKRKQKEQMQCDL